MDNEPLCMFHNEGKCNSNYGEGIACDGINVPKDCPYPFGELRNAKQKKKNERQSPPIKDGWLANDGSKATIDYPK